MLTQALDSRNDSSHTLVKDDGDEESRSNEQEKHTHAGWCGGKKELEKRCVET